MPHRDEVGVRDCSDVGDLERDESFRPPGRADVSIDDGQPAVLEVPRSVSRHDRGCLPERRWLERIT